MELPKQNANAPRAIPEQLVRNIGSWDAHLIGEGNSNEQNDERGVKT